MTGIPSILADSIEGLARLGWVLMDVRDVVFQIEESISGDVHNSRKHKKTGRAPD